MIHAAFAIGDNLVKQLCICRPSSASESVEPLRRGSHQATSLQIKNAKLHLGSAVELASFILHPLFEDSHLTVEAFELGSYLDAHACMEFAFVGNMELEDGWGNTCLLDHFDTETGDVHEFPTRLLEDNEVCRVVNVSERIEMAFSN